MVPDDRDRAHGRLRSLTAWISGLSAALVGIFAGIAAITIPGSSDASAAAAAGAPAGTDESNPPEVAPAPTETPAPVQVQPPASVPVAAPPGQPHARSGGSTHR